MCYWGGGGRRPFGLVRSHLAFVPLDDIHLTHVTTVGAPVEKGETENNNEEASPSIQAQNHIPSPS
jgi:hypothetical protein